MSVVPEQRKGRLQAIDALADQIEEAAALHDADSSFPAETFEALHGLGLLGLTAPAELGGGGLWWGANYLEFYEILERLARIDAPTGQMVQVHNHALGILSRMATPEQQRRFVPGIVERGALMASAGSEAKPTGKLADISRTELEDRPDGWHLTCSKHFATLSPVAEELLIWTAVPGEGPYQSRAVIAMVPREAAEVSLTDSWDVLGMRATVSWSVHIEDYLVPDERLIGEPGAWSRDPRTFTLAFAANHAGSAAGALEFLTGWVRDRPDLAGAEVTRVALGALSSDVFAAQATIRAAAALWEAGSYDDAELASVRALHLAKAVALNVVQRAFDVCGARATFRNLPLERMYRDIRTFSLHFRDEQYMDQVGQAMLDGSFKGKGYAGASTFPARRA